MDGNQSAVRMTPRTMGITAQAGPSAHSGVASVVLRISLMKGSVDTYWQALAPVAQDQFCEAAGVLGMYPVGEQVDWTPRCRLRIR